MPNNHKTTVFYDGDCPLCSREIALYKRLDKAKKINWIDINHSQVELSAEGIDYQDAMTLLCLGLVGFSCPANAHSVNDFLTRCFPFFYSMDSSSRL